MLPIFSHTVMFLVMSGPIEYNYTKVFNKAAYSLAQVKIVRLNYKQHFLYVCTLLLTDAVFGLDLATVAYCGLVFDLLS